MILLLAALLILFWTLVLKRLDLSRAIRLRLAALVGGSGLVAIWLSALRLVPVAVLVLVLGLGLAANLALRERARRGGFEDLGEEPSAGRPQAGAMERREALAVLGLDGEPDDDAVNAAYRRMIVRAHPDQGGSDYLAAKVNEARRVLLGEG